MGATTVLCALALMLIAGCSTGHHPVTSTSQKNARLASPAGDFVLGGTSRPAVKLRINSDGSYFAEHTSPIELWPMMEGNKVYPQRIRPSAEKGHWAWDRSSGALTLAPETAPSFACWPIDRLQFDPAHPDHLTGDGGVVLERVEK
jgi:hypothetical protein